MLGVVCFAKDEVIGEYHKILGCGICLWNIMKS